MTKTKAVNHSHCWEDKEPACGKKFHAICCLCGESQEKWDCCKECTKPLGKKLQCIMPSCPCHQEKPKCEHKHISYTIKVDHKVCIDCLEVVGKLDVNELDELTPAPTPQVEEWELELMKEFGIENADCIPVVYKNCSISRISYFIRSLIASREQQARKEYRERIVAGISKEFYEFNDKEADFECNQRVLKLRNTILNFIKNLT